MFIKHYNYRKQKHLPASVTGSLNFSIERDSKLRRLVSTVGATFRNSKWSNLSFTNLTSLQYVFDPNTYLTPLPLILLLLILSFNLSVSWSFYDLTPILFIHNFFDHVDSAVTGSELFSALIPVLAYSLFYLGSNLFILSTLFTDPQSSKDSGNHKDTSILKNRGVWGLLSNSDWGFLQTNTTVSDERFNSEFFSVEDLLLLKAFYEVRECSTTTLRPVLDDFSDVILYKEYIHLGSPYKQLRYDLPSQETFSEHDYVDVVREFGLGNFYPPYLTYQELNNFIVEGGLVSLDWSLVRHNSTLNSLRWVYMSNNLHRRTIFNSHKITEAKKLISLGYFDSSSTRSNVWFSDKYSKDLNFKQPKLRGDNQPETPKPLLNREQIRSNWSLLYKSTFRHNNLVPSYALSYNLTSSDSFQGLSFYESSFHFFLNRGKSFLSMGSVVPFTTPLLLNINHYPVPHHTDISPLWSTLVNMLVLPNRTGSLPLNPRHHSSTIDYILRGVTLSDRHHKSLNSTQKSQATHFVKPLISSISDLYSPNLFPIHPRSLETGIICHTNRFDNPYRVKFRANYKNRNIN